ncbi:P-loop NTPase fold protein [Halarcobacter ebronensis]|nr:P-loop NTPase fold protein [Halarcobacter ebronensis]QKF81510.1 KAP family NTPase (YfmG domain) [Halarcobacter ebronensis]
MLTNTTYKKMNMINDYAIDKIKYDFLDFDIYAQALSESLLNTQSPFSLGIYGEWGKGKTSLLNFLINEINSNKNGKKLVTVYYDSWKYRKENNLLIDLINTIEKEFQLQRLKFDDSLIINILDLLSYIKLTALNSTCDNNNGIYFENEEHIFQVYEVLKNLENTLFDEDFLIIVFIDNLDKCSSKDVINILDSINQIFRIKGFSFVIASDIDTLEYKLSKKLINSKEYLNRVINLPFYLPSFNGKINDLLENIYLRNNSDESLEQPIKNILNSISSLELLSPRLIIRLINRIKLCSNIYMKLNPNTQLSNENILSLFSISCILEEFFRELHSILIKNNSLSKFIIKLVQREEFYKDEILSNINVIDIDKEVLINIFEDNFNLLKMIFSTEEGKYWLENRAYRISTYEFLKSNNSYVESEKIDSLPLYKTDFSENAISFGEKEINPKEFIKIPNKEYEVSKYVITNCWFEEFILSGGYENSNYWTDVPSKIWLMNNKISSLDEKYDFMINKESIYFKKKFNQELLKDNFNSPLQPIVYITYYEAVAFCRYLTDLDNEYEYSIPTKEQWEYIANAGDRTRFYPWGNIWDNNYCNNATNQLNKTTQIGLFPQGDSTFGVSDMVGNVWVWTSTLDNNDYNYLKGGSWSFSESSYFKISNSQMNFYNNPSYQHYDIGFLCIRKKK